MVASKPVELVAELTPLDGCLDNGKLGEVGTGKKAAEVQETDGSSVQKAVKETASAADLEKEGGVDDFHVKEAEKQAGAGEAGAECPDATDQAEKTEQAPTNPTGPQDATTTSPPPIYEITIAAASKHVVEFNLDPEDLEYIAARIYIAVTTHIAVVLAAAAVLQLLLDFGGVHDSPEDGGRAFLRPGTIVRERST
eukprot:6180285-Pleurochrysis_carterae.AAC.1